MKDLKFRAWDKKDKNMLGCDRVAIAPDNGKFAGWSISGEGITIRADSERFAIMQFTGLKDKNGIDVYEGDIIEVESDIPTYIGIVGFCCGSFMVEADHITGYCWMDYEITVLGNVYENPGLIDKEEEE